jgi:23S rRNA pseudouridine1911/1915/1917 synthase
MMVVPAGQTARRLDIFISTQNAHVSRALAQRWIESGVITLNGEPTKPARRVRAGDVIVSHVPVRERPSIEPEPIPVEVLHEDDHILIVSKPPGLVMHPAPGHWTGTLLNGLVHHLGRGDGVPPSADGVAQRERPGLVHRLDKGTSGVLVIAKTDAAHRDLSRQFHVHSVRRVYHALVAGAVERGGLIELDLGRDLADRRRVSGRSAALRRAVTEFRVAERLGREATVVEVRPRTGRMHQIRAHLAAIGHPVLGDPVYGRGQADPTLTRPMLHATVLGFIHPATGERVEYRAPWPDDMEHAVAAFRRNAG